MGMLKVFLFSTFFCDWHRYLERLHWRRTPVRTPARKIPVQLAMLAGRLAGRAGTLYHFSTAIKIIS